MKCPNCGAALPEDARFCTECGTPVPELELAAEHVCAACGAEMPVGARFCTECGAKAADALAEVKPELTVTNEAPVITPEPELEVPNEAPVITPEPELEVPNEAPVITPEPELEVPNEAPVAEPEPTLEVTGESPATPVAAVPVIDEPATPIETPAAPVEEIPTTEPPAEANTPTEEPTGTCIKCGAKLESGAVFCTNCGAKQPPATTCAKCGAKLEPGAAFCTVCGTPVPGAAASKEPRRRPQLPNPGPITAKFGNNTPLFIALAVAVVLLVCVIGGVLSSVLGSNKKTTPAASSSVSAASEAAAADTVPTAGDTTTAATPATTDAPATAVPAEMAPQLSSLEISNTNQGYTNTYTYYFDTGNRLTRVLAVSDGIVTGDYTLSYTASGIALPNKDCIARYNTQGQLESVYYNTYLPEQCSATMLAHFNTDGSISGFASYEDDPAYYNYADTILMNYTRDAAGKITGGTASATESYQSEFAAGITVTAEYGTPSVPLTGTSAAALDGMVYNTAPQFYYTTASHGLVLRAGTGTDTQKLGSIPYGSPISVLATTPNTTEWVFICYENYTAGTKEYGWVNTQYINTDYPG